MSSCKPQRYKLVFLPLYCVLGILEARSGGWCSLISVVLANGCHSKVNKESDFCFDFKVSVTGYFHVRENFKFWARYISVTIIITTKTRKQQPLFLRYQPSFRTQALSLRISFLYFMPTLCVRCLPFVFFSASPEAGARWHRKVCSRS